MKHKTVTAATMMILIVSVLTGCGEKKVEYDFNEESERNSESDAVNSAELEQFCETKEWTEELSIEDTTAASQIIKIEAKINVPDTETMRVLELKALNGSLEFKKKVLNTFFGDTEYYYHEEENYTKEELQKWLPDDENLMATAPDTREIAEEFESVTHYAAFRSDVLYEIYLSDGMISIHPNWDDEEKCGPEKFRDYKYAREIGVHLQGNENECAYTQEEAQSISDEFMREMGLDTMECTLRESATWEGTNADDSENGEMEYIAYGYVFKYETGVDGVSISDFPEPYQYTTEYCANAMMTNGKKAYGGSPMSDDENGSMGNAEVTIYVADDGVESVNIRNAEVMEKISNPVNLLPLDKIQKIMRNEIMERTAKYYIDNYNIYNDLSLIYYKAIDDSTEKLTAIPVWCLSWREDDEAQRYHHPIFVNAIDGTIIHYADAEWAGIEVTEK